MSVKTVTKVTFAEKFDYLLNDFNTLTAIKTH